MTNKKKYWGSSVAFAAKFDYSENYQKYGNLIVDQPVQNLWVNILSQK